MRLAVGRVQIVAVAGGGRVGHHVAALHVRLRGAIACDAGGAAAREREEAKGRAARLRGDGARQNAGHRLAVDARCSLITDNRREEQRHLVGYRHRIAIGRAACRRRALGDRHRDVSAAIDEAVLRRDRLRHRDVVRSALHAGGDGGRIGGVLHGALMQLPIGRLDRESGRAEEDREDDGEQDRDRAALIGEDRVKSRNLDAAQHSLEAIEFRILKTSHLDPPLNRWS